MTWVDWAIVIVIVALGAGRAPARVFSLRLLAGRAVPGPGAGRLELRPLAAMLVPVVRIEAVADTIGFC